MLLTSPIAEYNFISLLLQLCLECYRSRTRLGCYRSRTRLECYRSHTRLGCYTEKMFLKSGVMVLEGCERYMYLIFEIILYTT